MRRTTLAAIGAALLLAGCGSTTAQEAFDVADEATAEAERANARAIELADELSDLEERVAALEAKSSE